jgi:hypothetical protein
MPGTLVQLESRCGRSRLCVHPQAVSRLDDPRELDEHAVRVDGDLRRGGFRETETERTEQHG